MVSRHLTTTPASISIIQIYEEKNLSLVSHWKTGELPYCMHTLYLVLSSILNFPK